ncbi:hypothetical protein ACH5RR_031069 [Cinchona calisaya]|uniref:Uncharacterized protein n=1 Tax=Cinchona calisaya TaxID=153742 RepID=A0ABD2YH53_9GENT
MQFVTAPTKENGAMNCNLAARKFCGVLFKDAGADANISLYNWRMDDGATPSEQVFTGLVEIGWDAFATLEQYDQERRQPQLNRRANITPPTKGNGVIDCYEAARYYGGVLIKDAGKNGAGLARIGMEAFLKLEHYDQEHQQPQPKRRANRQFVRITTDNTTAAPTRKLAGNYEGGLIKDADKTKPLLNLRRG